MTHWSVLLQSITLTSSEKMHRLLSNLFCQLYYTAQSIYMSSIFLLEQKTRKTKLYTSIQVYNSCAKSVVHICTKEVECFLFVFDLFHVTFFGHSEGRMR